MREFWGYYDNGTYRVGCNGATIYVYNQSNKELCKFKDIKHVYAGAFQPHTNIFIAKSTEGSLAVYDLEKCALQKKIVITQIGAQDEGFAFSPDGKLFYNIEKPFQSTRTQLTIYNTSDYAVSRTLFADETQMHLDFLEFNEDTEIGYILGFMRDENGIFDYGFIAQFSNDIISGIKKLRDEENYDYIHAYKSWEQSGYTKGKLEWSLIKDYSEKPHVSLARTYEQL